MIFSNNQTWNYAVEQSDCANTQEETLLPENYVLGEFDVLCGRGKKSFFHVGNEKLRKMVEHKLGDYAAATTKMEKSLIIREVISKIRESSKNSGFVKHDPITGRYYDVGDTMAREKTSQAFRDALYGLNKSRRSAKMGSRQSSGMSSCSDRSKSLGDEGSGNIIVCSENVSNNAVFNTSPSDSDIIYTPVQNISFYQIEHHPFGSQIQSMESNQLYVKDEVKPITLASDQEYLSDALQELNDCSLDFNPVTSQATDSQNLVIPTKTIERSSAPETINLSNIWNIEANKVFIKKVDGGRQAELTGISGLGTENHQGQASRPEVQQGEISFRCNSLQWESLLLFAEKTLNCAEDPFEPIPI